MFPQTRAAGGDARLRLVLISTKPQMSFLKRLTKRLTQSPIVQKGIGIVAAEYLRLVWNTSRVTIEPADIYEQMNSQLPIILAMWHGQHFLVPFVRKGQPAKVLISRHRDGEINAIAAERLGVGTIRGSGDMERRFDRKGGVGAFKAMLSAIEDGWSMALTADVPKISRIAGAGVIKLAQYSGRSICPVAVASSRRIQLSNWDRSAVNLPFSHIGVVAGEAIRVPSKADQAELEACRAALQTALDEVTARAYAIADHPRGSGRG
jgi:lysophospholipid acyltransferase (LPLAT)-like uncharacterized protein